MKVRTSSNTACCWPIITVAAVVAITQIGPKVADYFTDANTALPEAD